MTPERWRQITELFHAARERAPAEREALLADACGEDPALRREVEAMLAGHDDAGRFGDAPLVGSASAAAPGSSRVRALAPGSQLGPYRILSPLGAGGMGEVYRARDSKLHRDVAIKVLLPAVADDPDRLARFTREARVLASLNHPNIAHIHGLEDAAGIRALVMELVEGATLAERLVHAPLPLDEALPIAKQIAQALEAAHEQGIIHRDLKPANIKVRSDGTVKVLDFGLAKALEPAGADPSQSPTMTPPALRTEAGLILGTAAYMSPEQARGLALDKRSDIWALGCVLYEMLTGHRAFAGEEVSDTLAQVLTREPDWHALPAATPAPLRRLLRRCLEKDRRRRLDSAAAAGLDIDDALASPAGETVSIGSARRVAPVVLAALAAMLIVAGLAGGTVAWLRPPPSGTPLVSRLMVEPEGALPSADQGVITLSPDGRRLAYIVRSAGRQQLYLRDLDRFDGRPLPGTDGADEPVFSPDGNWIAFTADRQIKKIAVAGGPPVSLCECGTGSRAGLSWESNDALLFGTVAGIERVAAAGGKPSTVTMRGTGSFEHSFPAILPGGKALLYSSALAPTSGEFDVIAESLATGVRHVVGRGAGARYLPTGHLLYVHEGTLFAVPFDLARLEPTGDPKVLWQGVRETMFKLPQIAFSESGTVAYVPTSGGGDLDALVWVDVGTGEEHPTGITGVDFQMPRVSPDLQRVAIVSRSDIWLYDLTRDARRRLTADGGSGFPVWAPTGSQLSYRSDRTGRTEIYVQTVDDTVPEKQLPTDHNANIPLAWSNDGRYLAVVAISSITQNDIWWYALDGSSRARSFLETKFQEGGPTFSPDGRWLAYGTVESGYNEVHMRPFPGPGPDVPISNGGGNEPVWARKAGPLFYRQGDAMMAVEVGTAPAPSVGEPRRLFERPYNRSNALWPDYDVTPDGKRVLMIKRGNSDVSTRINVVLNWTEELKRLAPTAR